MQSQYPSFLKMLLFWMSLLCYKTSIGQVSDLEIESYKSTMDAVLKKNIPDTIKFQLLLDSVDTIDPFFTRYPFQYLNTAIEIATSNLNRKWRGELYVKLGDIYAGLSKKDSGEIMHVLALEDFEAVGLENRVLDMHFSLSNKYGCNDAADKALHHAYKAIAICESLKDDVCLGNAYLLNSGILSNIGKFKRSKKYVNKSMDAFKRAKNVKGIAEAYMRLASLNVDSLDVALENVNKAIALYESGNRSEGINILHAVATRADIYQRLEWYESEDADLDYMVRIMGDKKTRAFMQDMRYRKAMNKHHQGDFIGSRDLISKAINDPFVSTDPYLYYNRKLQVENFIELNQWDSAYVYQMKLLEMKNHDRLHESKLNMDAIEAKYEAEKKETIIASQKALIAQQKVIQGFAWGSALLLGLLLLQTYRNAKKRWKMNEKLRELDSLKTKLYTNITHEFRTPLTVIIGMASQIKTNPQHLLSDGLSMIERNGNHLLELINQLLDLSKLESGNISLNLRQGDIIHYMKYLVESLDSYASNRGVKVHYYHEDEEVIMDFDSEKIKIIISNLLTNALKFTPDGGDVYLMVRKINATDGAPSLLLKIKDTGIGISEEQLPYIFDRFYQVDDSTTRKREGSGIGLSLVKEMVTIMKGKISVRSRLDHDTEFSIELPITNKAEMNQNSLDAEVIGKVIKQDPILTDTSKVKKLLSFGSNKSKNNLLLIEDNPDVLAYIASCLQPTYNLIVAKNGKEGVDIALENLPDLIVTDVMMPIMDGLEVTNVLKANPLTSHIPIIMLTAKADITSKLEGLKHGADAYLSKPFNKEELQLRIHKILESRQKLQTYYIALLKGEGFRETEPFVAIGFENEFVIKSKEVVEKFLGDSNFSVEQFAKEMSISTSQLHSKVNAIIGVSPSRLIRQVRLTKAKDLLTNPDLAINTIAYETGFNDPGYFSRIFKKEFGVTPLQYRKVKLK